MTDGASREVVMPTVGDKVRVLPSKAGQPPREGVVTAVAGSMLRIRWSTGEDSSLIPGPGSVVVVGKVRKSASKKAAPRAAKKTGTRATKRLKLVKTTKSAPLKKVGKVAKKGTRKTAKKAAKSVKPVRATKSMSVKKAGKAAPRAAEKSAKATRSTSVKTAKKVAKKIAKKAVTRSKR
jgi:hypothetical protein